jgi:prolyl-tRNA editing enzyme YbaK/EbsC (Cys-tRNA(Pro) deacylase)
VLSVVTEHLEQRGAAFEVLPHRQAYTSIDEARALGVDADEVLKTLAVRTEPGYVLVVIPAARRLDLQLFGTGGITTVALVKRPERGSDEPVA